MLTIEQEKALALKVQAGDEQAREDFVMANLGLVNYTAMKFQGRGLDMEDLVQEGTIGLMTAVNHFDGSKGVKFSTYATIWIQQSIRRAIANHGSTIRVPVWASEAFGKMRYAISDLTLKLNHEPNNAEIAEAMGTTEEKVDELRNSVQSVLSLDVPMGDMDMTFMDLMQSHEIAPDVAVAKAQERERIDGLIAKLPDLQAKVIKFRFGFDDGEAKTLDEVGKLMGFTREYARQIEEKALAKLRKVA